MSDVMQRVRRAFPIVPVLAVLLAPGCGADAGDALNEYGNPLTLEPRPTAAGITAADLRTRLYAFAHDSMMGRAAGREGNRKGTAYIARELERFGVEPAGVDGTYFQGLPFVVRKYTDASTLAVDGAALRWLEDWVAVPGDAPPRPVRGAAAIDGGALGDTASRLTPARAAGRVVVFTGPEDGLPGRAIAATLRRFAGAAAIATVDLDALSPDERRFLNDPAGSLADPAAPEPQPAAARLRITRTAAERIFGRPLDGLAPGTAGATLDAELDYVRQPVPELARNVIGVVRGSDPALAGQYVAIGAHNDHVGYVPGAVDHDSARTHAAMVQALRIVGGDLLDPDPQALAALRVDVDSLRRLQPARLDSIRNGADDDGSGSMALLEIAQAIAAAPTPPRRSVLFIWHTAEERGLLGSRWFVQHPTVPLDSIVAMINVDMVGRGRADDLPGGGPDYLAVIGSYRLSNDLGEIIAGVNARQSQPFQLDYKLDEPIDWPGYNNLYNRSDHVHYARQRIPIAFFFSGLHHDYHRITDEPQYIEYPKLERVARLLHDVLVEIANRDARPALNGPDAAGLTDGE